MQVVRRHLAYRDDELLAEYIELERPYGFMTGIPHENPMAVIVDQLRSLATRNTHVVIEGPVGAGRFAVAKVLRDLDPTPTPEWITIPCAGASPTQLSGGLPQGCVLLLREIDRAESVFQRALLGLIDEANPARPRRVICTTSRPLTEAVADSGFDALLQKRLAVGTRIIVPPLSRRLWDIPPLVVSRVKRSDPGKAIQYISYAAFQLLMNFNWTGEVEQLLLVVDAAVRQTLDAGEDRITFASIADQFKRVTAGLVPARNEDPFANDDPTGDKHLALVQGTGSEEMAAFYEEQYRAGIYSDTLNDRDHDDAGWSKFDRELWTGCYVATGNPHHAMELYGHIRRTGIEPLPTTEAGDASHAEALNRLSDEQKLFWKIRLHERQRLEEWKSKVSRVAMDDTYGRNMVPSESDVGSRILIRLEFSPLYASPQWLTDQNWELRDSWNVPLEWADTRILFDVRRMEADLEDFLLLPGGEITVATATEIPRPTPKEAELNDAAAGDQNVFVPEGAGWKTTFAGITAYPTNKLGLHYIRVLLGDPYKQISARELWQFGEGLTDDAKAAVLEFKGGSSTSAGKGAGPIRKGEILDEDAVRQYKKRIEKLEEDYDFALNAGRLEEAGEIQEEIDQVNAELAKSKGVGGRPRRFSDDLKLGDSVSQVIRYAIKRLEPKHPELATHLRVSIKKFDTHLSYAPEDPTDWVT
jgi:hypothetical protein